MHTTTIGIIGDSDFKAKGSLGTTCPTHFVIPNASSQKPLGFAALRLSREAGELSWDDLGIRLSSSHGPSTPQSSSPVPSTRPSYSPEPSGSAPSHEEAECLNCKFLVERIKTLEAKIKILDRTLEMERHPENHTFESTAILHELYNDMGRLGLE
ncbi:hypothetical protein Tco_0439682 [Tanacetum coccineum]